MQKFKPSLITAAFIASGMAIFSQPLYAQEPETAPSETAAPEEETIERIEVRGFSTSLIQSLNQKRFGDTVSEQLSADDLGGLPDVSMADALTRLPGISAVRTGGQAAEINIRGLSGGFVFSTLNGREQVSTSGTRSIEFDQYPSELINSAAVYKSPKASLIEGGVAGTVELRTASPLSNDEQHTFNANVRGMYNDRASEIPDGEEFGHRLSFSYQGKFMDDTLGVALGYARLYQPSVSTQFIGLAYNGVTDVDGVHSDADCQDQDFAQLEECELISEGFEMQHKGGEETRDGYVAAIEWAPVDNFTLKADAFISKFDSEAFARGFRVKLGGIQTSITNPVVVDRSVIGGTFTRTADSFTRVELVNDDNQDFDQVESYGINADWDITDNLSAQFDISLSKAESNFRNGLTWALVGDGDPDSPRFDENVSISYQLNGLNLPDLAFNQTDLFTDLDRVRVSKYGIYPFQNDDELDAYRLDFQYALDMPILSGLEFGARYSDREYKNDRSVFEFGNDSAFSASQPSFQLSPDMVDVVNWEGDFSYFPSYLAIDLDSTLNAWFPGGVPQPQQTWGPGAAGVINGPGIGPSTAWSVQESGDVFETVSAAYLMANIDTEIGDMRVTGNVGVRYVESKQSSTTLQRATRILTDPVTGVQVEVSDPTLGAQNITDEAGLINNFYRPDIISHEYTDLLPSINLNFGVTDNSQLRVAAAKVMGRAPINRFAANASTNVEVVTAVQDRDSGEVTLSTETARINGSSRNSPYLEPFYATQYDLSYEYYFDETDGAFIAAAFYKDIESFIENIGIEPYDFAGNGFVVPDSVQVPVFLEPEFVGQDPELVLDAQGNPVFVTVPTENGNYETAINNAEGGYIRGLEFAYTQIYSMLPGAWAGLGVSASYSYTESEIQRTVGNGVFASALPGLSENVAQLTVFWEYEGFETRISGRYRDQFVSEQVAINDQTVNFDEELVIDYQASYEINDNLSVLFQINNVTDEPTKSYFSSQEQTGTIQFFGTQYFMGLTYSL
ncbi:TonB-dependent receptor [Alteromonas oceanisediminis]|uniref:TonB-dependent receptor n=1 Tax=Alteromonas oceanisediminis TaxID=2836180 RepID=UPI001BDB1BDB|nr:TonB-dependent receptor [Alteromonas oceanisediminis]MBT0586470.1 TonB-dependent receptor [Alteromonas oceanisediminis]